MYGFCTHVCFWLFSPFFGLCDDAGDKYTIHVDPDLTIGASSKTSGLKGIIEDVQKQNKTGDFGGTVFVGCLVRKERKLLCFFFLEPTFRHV